MNHLEFVRTMWATEFGQLAVQRYPELLEYQGSPETGEAMGNAMIDIVKSRGQHPTPENCINAIPEAFTRIAPPEDVMKFLPEKHDSQETPEDVFLRTAPLESVREYLK